MTETPSPDPSAQSEHARPLDDLPGDGAVDDGQVEMRGEELPDESVSEIAGAGDAGDSEKVDPALQATSESEVTDEVPSSRELSDLSEEVFVFVSSATAGSSLVSKVRSSFRGMGWQMMAAAGVVLLVAGFAAGVFFPDPSNGESVSTDEVVTTTAATVPTADSSTTTSTAAPSTTAAPSPTASTVTTQNESVVVPSPDFVDTGEPVADVADRLLPSVVHLEISSDIVFEQGAGSGVIFDSSGYILTAAHVVETVVDGAAEVTVRLSNGDRLPGEVVGTDPDSDVAVVRVDRSGLTPAELALDDAPRAGQLVVAVGSPWGLESSVTSGVISAADRMVDGKILIQSDAVLYPGNSGGALADRHGRLIGINVSIFSNSTSLEQVEFQGVGFAVPVDIAYRVAQALIAGRPVHTAFLGVSGRDTQGDAGVEVMEIFPGSGAEQSGLMVGDVVVAVGGRPVTGIADLAARIRHLLPGDVLVLSVMRGEDELTLTAALLPRSEVMPDQPSEDSPEGETP